MSESGLEDIMSAGFGGVKKMLIGKSYPQNVRAVRIVAENILQKLLNTNEIQSYTDLIEKLEERADDSRTAKMWVDNFLKPVFIMMRFVHAEREANWLLHLKATEEMIPYFFSSGTKIMQGINTCTTYFMYILNSTC